MYDANKRMERRGREREREKEQECSEEGRQGEESSQDLSSSL